MDRRGFLKKYSLIPFIGSLVAWANQTFNKENTLILREAESGELCIVKTDFYERFSYDLDDNDITDYVWVSKQGWSWSKGYRDRAIEMLSGKIPQSWQGRKIYKEIPAKLKDLPYKVYELILFQDYGGDLIILLYVFSSGAVIRVEILEKWIKNKPIKKQPIVCDEDYNKVVGQLMRDSMK